MDEKIAILGDNVDSFAPFVPPELMNDVQIAVLVVIYGAMLFLAAKLMSDGSDLLLLVPGIDKIVGSVVIPILGAVPDGMMVLFSGMSDNAQKEVSVGVGALAGSTVMLLTVPWLIAVIAGRVTVLKNAEGVKSLQYKCPKGEDPKAFLKLKEPRTRMEDLFATGVGLGEDILINAKVMALTAVPYVIIIIPALMVDHQATSPHPTFQNNETVIKDDAHQEYKAEVKWAELGLLACTLLFAKYLKDEWSKSQEDKLATRAVEAIQEGHMNLRGVMAQFKTDGWKTFCKADCTLDRESIPAETLEDVRMMCKILAPFFAHYDINRDGTIDYTEFVYICHDIRENNSADSTKRMFEAADVDGSGTICFAEFVASIMSMTLELPQVDLGAQRRRRSIEDVSLSGMKSRGSEKGSVEGSNDDDEKSEAEEEDMPADIAEMDPADQQWAIKQRAATFLALGTGLCLLFSDPMVDLLNAIGNRLGINPFYISFVLAPVASNASELFSAYAQAAKRTQKSITTSLSTLIGAGIMNNSFCLGIFFALIVWKELAWEFTAETFSILLVELLMVIYVFWASRCNSSICTLFHALIIFSFYFGCLGCVAGLEALGFD